MKVKRDKVDSETLAPSCGSDLLPESYVPPKDIRELRDLVRRRAFLVRMRAQLKNRVHADLAKRRVDPEAPLFTRNGGLSCLEAWGSRPSTASSP